MRYRLHGGRLIRDGRIEQMDLLVENGIIQALLSPDERPPEDCQILDCTGCYVSPGFVDIHQHGGGGNDYMDDDPDAFFHATEAHLAHGTTSVMPTLLSANKEALLGAVARYKQATRDRRIRANLLGIHIEGPYISAAQAGAQKPEHIRIFDEKEYGEIAAVAEGAVKRWSVAPEVEGAEKFAEFALKNGITLSIAHSNADLETVRKAYDWGFRHVTHLYSCTSSIVRVGGFRVPGVLEAAYLLDGMNVEVIADGCHLPHSLLAYVAKFKGHDRIALITDAMRAAGQDVTESFLGSAEDPLPVVIEDGVAKLCDRSAFGGSIATADRLLANMVAAGVSLPDAVDMLTANPLHMMGLTVKKGQLQVGYDADLCVFDEQYQIKTVLCGGKIVVQG